MAEEIKNLGIILEKDVPVKMRDGVILRADIFRPDAHGRFPALLMRTPYNKESYTENMYGGSKDGKFEKYVGAGYVVAVQDVRGRYASEGKYIPFCAQNTGEGEDGYDTIEWLAAQPYCNGKIGTFGISYNAWAQWMLAKFQPPHLVAMCAVSIPVELTDVDWPWRPGRRVRFWMNNIAPDLRRREGLMPPHTSADAIKIWDQGEQDKFIWFLPWIELPRYLPKGLAEYVEDWLCHTNRKVWKFDEAHKKIEVPNLDFTGWYDHCNSIGHFTGMQKNARTEIARTQTKIIIGPWNHVCIGKRKVGEIDFGPQAEMDVDGLIIRWFDFWLKGMDKGIDKEPPVRYFVVGSGEWKSAQTWPPDSKLKLEYFLGSNGDANNANGSGILALELRGQEQHDSFNYDPKNPVPTLWGKGLFFEPSDRRLLEHRRDILYYRTPLLDEDIEIAGYPEVILYASSSALDTDFFARFVDENPDGQALESCYGMVRARYRNSMEREELLKPGEITEFRIKLGATACCFRKGHRIRLEITSSDFPNYDRNHNTGKNDILDADMVIAQQKIFHSLGYRSSLILPVVE